YRGSSSRLLNVTVILRKLSGKVWRKVKNRTGSLVSRPSLRPHAGQLTDLCQVGYCEPILARASRTKIKICDAIISGTRNVGRRLSGSFRSACIDCQLVKP